MPVGKETIEQFAQRIKSKYPAYKDVPDTDLVNKIVDKHPEYRDRVDFGSSRQATVAPAPQAAAPPSFPGSPDFSKPASYLAPQPASSEAKLYNDEVMAAGDRMQAEAQKVDPAIRSILTDTEHQRRANILQSQLQEKGDLANVNPRIQQELQRILPKPLPVEIPQDAVDNMKQQAQSDPTVFGEILRRHAELNPDKAGQIKADMYLLNSQSRAPGKEAKILTMAQGMKEGKLDYNLWHPGGVEKPEGFFASIVTGHQERNKELDDYEYFQTHNDNDIKTKLNADRAAFDPDEPVPTPSGFKGALGAGLGGNAELIAKGGGAAALSTMLGGPEVAPYFGAAMTTPEMTGRAYAGSLKSNYYQLLDQGVPEDEALKTAKNQATVDMVKAGAQGALMTVAGARFGLKGAEGYKFTPQFKNIITGLAKETGKFAKEALPNAAISGGLEAGSNIIAKSQGINRDVSQNVFEAAGGQLAMDLALGGVLRLGGKASKVLLNNLSKQPEGAVQSSLKDMESHGTITPVEGQAISDKIDSYKSIDSQIPPHIEDENTRIKIADLIQHKTELEDKLETLNKAYHETIKNKIKDIDEQVQALSGLSVKEKPEGATPAPKQTDGDKALTEMPEEIKSPKPISNGDETIKTKQAETREAGQTNGLLNQPGEGQGYAIIRNVRLKNQPESPLLESRHADTVDDGRGITSGPNDHPLSATGRKDANDLANEVAEKEKATGVKVTRVIGSDLERNEQTQKVVSDKVGATTESRKELRTWDIGEFDGMKDDDFKRVQKYFVEHPDEKEFEGKKLGESFNEYKDRIIKARQDIEKEPPGTLLINHSNNMMLWDAYLKNGREWNDQASQDYLNSEKPEPATLINKTSEVRSEEESQTTREEENVSSKEPPPIKMWDLPFTPSWEEVSGITHAEAERTRQEFGLGGDRYESDTKSDIDLNNEADKKIKEGYDIEGLLNKMRSEGYHPSDVENTILKKYKAYLSAKIKANPSLENLNAIRDFSKATDIAGTLQGRSFRSRQGLELDDDSLEGYFNREMQTTGTTNLSPEDIATVNKEYEDISTTTKKYVDKISQLEADLAKERAKNELKKTKPSGGTRKTKSDYTQERSKIIDDIKEKLRKARGETNIVAVPYLKELIAVAPDVAKLVKSYVDEFGGKLEDVVKGVHDQMKEIMPGVTEKDIHNIIAGEYSQKRPLNDLQASLRDLRTQAQLVNKLEALERGEEPKTKPRRDARNRAIEELRSKIKDIQKETREAGKFYREKIQRTPLEALKDRLKGQIAELEDKLKKGDYSMPAKRVPIKLDKEAAQLQEQLIELKQAREKRLAQIEYDKSSLITKGYKNTMEAIGIPRTLMASADLSAPLRQGAIATISHPIVAGQAAVEMIKSALSQESFDKWMFELKQSPIYETMKESGLYIADPNTLHMNDREEAFMSHMAEKLPLGVGKVVAGSERAYTMYLNKMRTDLFMRAADAFASEGKTPQNRPDLYKSMAKYINATTGRGELVGGLKTAAPVLNNLFFSPRLIAARLMFFNPVYYIKMAPEVRMMVLKDMSKFIGVGLSVLALAKLGGADVEKDPRSPDFGKIKVGDTRWDVWGGFQQYVRVASQIISGQAKSSQSGDIIPLTETKKENDIGDVVTVKPRRTRADVALTFLHGKLAPVPGTVWDALAGKDVVGKPFDPETKIMDLFTPMVINDVKDAWKDQGFKSLFTVGFPSALGVGVQTYAKDDTKKSSGLARQ